MISCPEVIQLAVCKHDGGKADDDDADDDDADGDDDDDVWYLNIWSPIYFTWPNIWDFLLQY